MKKETDKQKTQDTEIKAKDLYREVLLSAFSFSITTVFRGFVFACVQTSGDIAFLSVQQSGEERNNRWSKFNTYLVSLFDENHTPQ